MSQNNIICFMLFGIIMKKKDIVDLIRYFVDGNDSGFRNLAYDIAIEFNQNGDTNLGGYILSLLSSKAAGYIPQSVEFSSDMLKKVELNNSSNLLIPETIMNDINGIINAIKYNAGIGKFLFSGHPGTGKTEMVKQLARILDRQLFIVNIEMIIDSHLGQTAKNISQIFDEMNRQSFPESMIVLFDELDSLALDRVNSRDLREMGRATSALMKGFDDLNPNIVLIATTNMKDYFDKALLRRFDKIIDFDRYNSEELIGVALSILEVELNRFNISYRNKRLCRKIFSCVSELPYPGEMRNIIRSSIAFSDPSMPEAYVRNIFNALLPNIKMDMQTLQSLKFSLRDMEILLGISKSTLSRKFNLDGESNE